MVHHNSFFCLDTCLTLAGWAAVTDSILECSGVKAASVSWLLTHVRRKCDSVQVVVGKKLDDVFMVMEFMEHDLKGLMEDRDASNPLFAMSEVCASSQLDQCTIKLSL